MVEAFDTAVFLPGRGLYVFADDLVWRYSGGRREPDAGYPRAITAAFPGAFARGVDAALVDPDGALLLFRGDQHIRYDVAKRRPELGYPRPHAIEWPDGFARGGIDAALAWAPDIVYVFSGDRYLSLSPSRSRVRPGFPKPIAGNWLGLNGGPVRAALSLPSGLRVLIGPSGTVAYDSTGQVSHRELELPLPTPAATKAPASDGNQSVFRSLRFRQSLARADLEAIAAGRLRLGRRGDPEYPAPIRSRGPAVHEVQGALIELGHPLPHGADGCYGNETYQTVLAYKRKHNIRTASGYLDGIVGPKTIHHMDAALPVEPPPPPPPPPRPDDAVVRWKALLGPACRDGNDVQELVGGPEAFRAMHAAIRTARGREHYIYLLGWWLDLDEPLDVPTTGPACPANRGGPSTLRRLLSAASDAGVQVRVVLWDQPGTKNSKEVDFVDGLPNGAAFLDNHQGGFISGFLAGSQHQKALVVKGADGLIAFCGGVDINCDRVCPGGACGSSGGGNVVQASSGSAGTGQPLHDVHCRIAGPAAWDLLRVFVKRWYSNSSHDQRDAKKGPLRGLSEPVPQPVGQAVVRIGETYNATATLPSGSPLSLPSGRTTFRDRTVQEILLTVIGQAQKFLYIEDQYLINMCAAEAIRRALPRLDHVTILIAASQICDMPQRWALRKRFITHIRTSPHQDKLRVFVLGAPGPPGRPPIFGPHTYVHAKMMIADDEIAVIGSANMNRRGWEHDTEVVAAVMGPARDGTPLARKLRLRLWSQHLCARETEVSDPILSKARWRPGPPTRVLSYDPFAERDPVTNFLIPGGEGVIDPADELASAPCCRIHGPSCPSRAQRPVAPPHGAETELSAVPLEVEIGAGTNGHSAGEVTQEHAAPVAEAFELVEAREDFASASYPAADEAEVNPGGGLAVRILWPALGFPAVIAPGTAQGSRIPAPARQASVLLLSNRPTLTAEDAARDLRVVPWVQRARRYIPSGQPGCFTAAELTVRTDSPTTPLLQPAHDDRGDAVRFGADGQSSISASLARPVRRFYERQGLRYLHEIRISEAACARLPDGQYHLFWNGRPNAESDPSDEMKLLLDQYALPTRRAELTPDKRHERLKITTLLDEYQFEYGVLHPPYQQADRDKRLTEVLHPLFVRRALVSRPAGSVSIAHVTDTHVNARADVYEENLKSNDPSITWDGTRFWYKKNRVVRYNNFNRSFDRIYADAKRGADVILMTGDLIDYGRGPLGLVDNGRYRNRLDEDWTYQTDRNWFLFYYLLASRDAYGSPVYTSLGNHDWRLNPYPPFAPGAPDPPVLLHNYLDFTEDEQKTIIRAAHGHGHDTKYSYSELGAERLAKAIGGYFTGELSFDGSPLETNVQSVIWYLLLINPFLDYAFPLPGGQQVLMLDWGKDEEIYNFESARDWMEYSQRAKNCLSTLQEWHLSELARSPGKAKIIGLHAPPLGPAERWTDEDLYEGEKVFGAGQDSRMRKPTDGKTVKVEKHTLCAIAPKGAPIGVAAIYGTIVHHRDEFIRKVGESASGIRLVLSGHIHREGLLVAYPPTNDHEARLLRSVTYTEATDHARGVGPGIAAIRRTKGPDGREQVRAFPAPLYVNTTSAGPRGNQYVRAPASAEAVHNNVAPGWVRVQLAADGTVKELISHQLPEPPSTTPASRAGAREAFLV